MKKVVFLAALCMVLLIACISVPIVFGKISDYKEVQKQTDIVVNATISEKENLTESKNNTYDETSDVWGDTNTKNPSEESTQNQETTLKEETTEKQTDETTTSKETTTEETTTQEEVTTKKENSYFIKVNRVLNCVTVYTKDAEGNYTVPYKAMVCSVAKNITNTPAGSFQTIIRYNWRLLEGNVYGQYATRIYQSILFHSVPYYTKNKGDLEYQEFNLLGQPASAGCVRLCVRDAKWIADNCPIGTPVIIYDDATSPGPLGKPEMIKIPENSPYRGWDPTDPDIRNPWNQFGASITSDDSVTITAGTYNAQHITYILNAKALDTCGNVITDKIKVNGSVNWNQAGSYQVQLSVTDAIGRTAAKWVTIHVKERETVVQQSQTKPSEVTNTDAERK